MWANNGPHYRVVRIVPSLLLGTQVQKKRGFFLFDYRPLSLDSSHGFSQDSLKESKGTRYKKKGRGYETKFA